MFYKSSGFIQRFFYFKSGIRRVFLISSISMVSTEIRKKFLNFFENKGHKIVPSSSLLPKDDPSVLLTTAGMQQFKPYFTGDKDPMKDFGTLRTASIQKSFRTSDIDEVGDESHLTFFQMLGHFSFGDYFKKETIKWTYEFLTDVLKISKERISVSVFGGDSLLPNDEESYQEWLKVLPVSKIKRGTREDGNVWGPAGPEGPCGACNEVYIDGLEVATLVFMEFYSKDGIFTPLKQKGVDVGWGFERVVKVLQSAPTIFETDLFEPIIQLIPHKNVKEEARAVRIITDHIRGSVFLIADGVTPLNVGAGYILRRLLRRAIRYGKALSLDNNFLILLAKKVIEIYKEFYPELFIKKDDIVIVIEKENEKFGKTLEKGLKELEKKLFSKSDKVISGNDAFYFYESYGFPIELISELAKEKGFTIDKSDWEEAYKKHQEISRAGAEKKFGGHGLILNTGELKAGNEEELKIVTRLHTATHLLNAALRKVLGNTIEQCGSDITPERTRFDFKFSRKLTSEEIKEVEAIVNHAVEQDFMVKIETLPLEKAKKTGALYMENSQYPDPVKVYTIGSNQETFSKELCGGPHVNHTSEVGIFKIIKEESSSAGVRRIRAVVE